MRTGAIQRTLGLILVLNVLVVLVKLLVGLRTGSLAVIGATVESALDAMNNVIGMLLVALAARGPDEDHPYGHDKFETLGALAIVGFLSISCFELMRNAFAQLLRRDGAVSPTPLELALLAATAAVNVVVVWYERRRGRALNSPLLLADAAHTGGDIFVTALAFASLALTRAGYAVFDPWLAMVVALVIAWSGYRILRVTVPILVDQRAVDAAEIRRVVSAISGISGVPSARSRTSASGTLFAEVTITCDGALTVARAHELADAAEAAIRRSLGAADVTVHVEPVQPRVEGPESRVGRLET
ncbi:MAG: cation diffusion facilitator family transporter [Gemmatimonadales bacterium]